MCRIREIKGAFVGMSRQRRKRKKITKGGVWAYGPCGLGLVLGPARKKKKIVIGPFGL